jgi:DNA-binding MurR/RpiR family transcriptional regulator
MMPEPTIEQLKIGYDNFRNLKEKMAASNKKYRLSEKGALVTKKLHKIWTDSKKDDLEYQKKINKNQRERYRLRKLLKDEKVEKNDEIILDNQNKSIQSIL